MKGYSFTIEAPGAASYSLKVMERVVSVTDKAIDMSAGGAPANVNLANGCLLTHLPCPKVNIERATKVRPCHKLRK